MELAMGLTALFLVCLGILAIMVRNVRPDLYHAAQREQGNVPAHEQDLPP